jgi:hypothetical protein
MTRSPDPEDGVNRQENRKTSKRDQSKDTHVCRGISRRGMKETLIAKSRRKYGERDPGKTSLRSQTESGQMTIEKRACRLFGLSRIAGNRACIIDGLPALRKLHDQGSAKRAKTLETNRRHPGDHHAHDVLPVDSSRIRETETEFPKHRSRSSFHNRFMNNNGWRKVAEFDINRLIRPAIRFEILIV